MSSAKQFVSLWNDHEFMNTSTDQAVFSRGPKINFNGTFPTDANAAADAAIASMDNQPSEWKVMFLIGVAALQGNWHEFRNWPQWVISARDTADANFNANKITYFNTFFTRFNSLGKKIHYLGCDLESVQRIDAIKSGITSPHETKAVTAGSRSGTTCTLTIGTHTITAGEKVVVDGMTPAGYNGIHEIDSVTSTTITYEAISDPGAATVNGSVYRGNNAANRMWTMIQNDASAKAALPLHIDDPNIVATDWESSSVINTSANLWNPWAHFVLGEQIRKCVLEPATSNLGYTPLISNYNDLDHHVDYVAQHSNGLKRSNLSTNGWSSPECYLSKRTTGSILDGATDAERRYQWGLNLINTVIYHRKAGISRMMPWISFDNESGDPGFVPDNRWHRMVYGAFHALGVNYWNVHGSDGANHYSQSLRDFITEDIPGIKQVDSPPDPVPLSTRDVTIAGIRFKFDDVKTWLGG